MNLQLPQIKKLSFTQGFSKINIVIDIDCISIIFHFRAEFNSNDIDYARLYTQKNELRNFKTIDSAYKLIDSLLCPKKDLFVDVVISDNTKY